MNHRDDERINVHFVPGIMINGDDMNGPGCFKDTSYDSFFCEYKDNSLNGGQIRYIT